ncbi:MAG: hypothetical protein UZ14_CFX002000333 [Chloroflexi bacterium OLB14]|nr:MAG: hypothetical protein UZ14_CFX002000333 [Chloroflexi bacterium OLB14]
MTLHQVKKQITKWGALMIFIYIIYVIAFPLIPHIYYDGNMLDMEMILRNGARWFIFIYMLGLLLLFYAFYKITKLLHSFSKEKSKTKQTHLKKKYIHHQHFIWHHPYIFIPHHRIRHCRLRHQRSQLGFIWWQPINHPARKFSKRSLHSSCR